MVRYLLDTSIVIYVIKRRPAHVAVVFNSKADQLAISAITLSELMHGVERSSDPARNLSVVRDFQSRLVVLPYGERASVHYGGIRSALEKTGQTIGVNDLHIAAHARSEGLILVTNNRREFDRVPGLLVENWIDPDA